MMALLLAATTAAVPPPADWRADSVLYDSDHRQLRLEGDFTLKRGELRVRSDTAVADLAEGKAAPAPAKGRKAPKKKAPTPAIPGVPGQEVRRFTLDGHVHVERGARTADGEHAVYDSDEGTLTLTGAPVLRDGAEQLTGERVVLHLDTDAAEVARPKLVLRRSEAPAVQAASAGAAPKAVPVQVEAARLELDQKARVARFREDVVVRRGDLTIRGPRMDARYGEGGALSRLDLSGGVELRQGERRATGKSAVYDAQARTLQLTGDPKLYDRGDVLSGDRIEVFLETHQVRIDRARGRVRPEQHQGEGATP